MSDTPDHYQPDPRLRRRNRLRRTPLIVKLIRFGFRYLGPIFPNLAGRYAYRIWTSTHRHPVPARERAWAREAETRFIPSAHGELAVYHWGSQGPTVLLMHGWDGRGTQLGSFAAPLVEAGYQVVAFDGPGHGKSPGKSASIFKLTDAAEAVAAAHAPLAGVIAHSFGIAVAAYALNTGRIQAPKVVGISAPASIHYLLDRYSHILHIPSRVRERMQGIVETLYHPGIWDEISPEVNARGITDTPALFLHDDKDRDVPSEQAERLHAAWPGSHLETTSGLGHNRILRNTEVIERAVEFIRNGV